MGNTRLNLWQIDRETPRAWGEPSAFSWALKTGTLIGTGFLTRIGYTVFYVAPIGILLAGDPISGTVILGTYGATRGFSSLVLNRWLALDAGFDRLMMVLFRLRTKARILSAATTTLIALTGLAWAFVGVVKS